MQAGADAGGVPGRPGRVVQATYALLTALRGVMAPQLSLTALVQLTQQPDMLTQRRAWHLLASQAADLLPRVGPLHSPGVCAQLCNAASSAVQAADDSSAGRHTAVQQDVLAVFGAVAQVSWTSRPFS